jgi:hypothetical protein
MDKSTHDSPKWWAPWEGRRGRRLSPAREPDALVAAWKAAWLKGASAAWAPLLPAPNPYTAEMERAAWDAGWKWASQNPNRRAGRAPRFAHPLRRATDRTFSASLKRAAAVGATGVTVYALSKALRRWLPRTKPDES